jgi:hypothetical protein
MPAIIWREFGLGNNDQMHLRTAKAIPNTMTRMMSIVLNKLPPRMKNNVASEK